MHFLRKKISIVLLGFATALAYGESEEHLETQISTLKFRPVLPLTMTVHLGGLLLPGQEELGTASEDAVRNVLDLGPDKRRVIEISEPLAIKLALSGREAISCGTATVTITAWEIHEITPVEVVENLFGRLAERLGLRVADLAGHVIVTSILQPRAVITGCRDLDAATLLQQRINGSVIGYRAGVEINAYEAVGKSKQFSILRSFELEEIAKDRGLIIRSIVSDPTDALIGYADPIRLAGRDRKNADDERFLWIGRTPLEKPRNMATGRFYFRLKPRDGSSPLTLFRDLTLSDNDTVLKLL